MTGLGAMRVMIAGDVAWTVDGSRVVAMDLTTPGAVPRVLENSAAVIWEEIGLTGPIVVNELLTQLSDMFDTDEIDIRPGVEDLIANLIELRLLRS